MNDIDGNAADPDDSWFPVADIPRLLRGHATDAIWTALDANFDGGVDLIARQIGHDQDYVLALLTAAGAREHRRRRLTNYWLEVALVLFCTFTVAMVWRIVADAGTSSSKQAEAPDSIAAHYREYQTIGAMTSPGSMRFTVIQFAGEDTAAEYRSMVERIPNIAGYETLKPVSAATYGDQSSVFAGTAALHGVPIDTSVIVVRDGDYVYVLEALETDRGSAADLTAITAKLLASNNNTTTIADRLPPLGWLPAGYTLVADQDGIPDDLLP